MIKVLAIDGGGIRGIIPALVLAEIEQRTGKGTAELFDLIAGTSTGGILALGLSKPGRDGRPQYTAQDLVKLYETEGKRIFSRSLWHRIRALGNLLDEKYPSKGIETVLREYFGEARLGDALAEVIITSYDIERRNPFFFKSRRAQEKGYNFLMRDVARATSAAPTYFEALQLFDLENPSEYYPLVDGGIFANNPTMCGYVEAKRTRERKTDFLVVSLGTGLYTRPLLYKKAKDWGLAEWAVPILDVVFDGVSDTVDYQMRQLLPAESGVQRYYRFQAKLDEKNDKMDDTDPDNLRELVLLAEGIIRDQQEELKSLCKQLAG